MDKSSCSNGAGKVAVNVIANQNDMAKPTLAGDTASFHDNPIG